MGCGLGTAADHAVAKATQRVEKDQVIEKAPMISWAVIGRGTIANCPELL